MARERTPAGGMMLAHIVLASSETIAWRWWMMLTGTCSAEEYRRMVMEKLKASQQMSAAALSGDPSLVKFFAPWYRTTRRNARRLRKK